jgi:hypothetical protein
MHVENTKNMFGPKSNDVTGLGRRCTIREFHNLHFSSNILRLIKQERFDGWNGGYAKYVGDEESRKSVWEKNDKDA